VDERDERAEVGAADGFGGVECGAAGEDGEPREERLLVAVEELVAPVQGGAERPVPGRCVARACGQQLEPAFEAFEHRVRFELSGSGRGELDRQRETV
jgi:hypothetical protein